MNPSILPARRSHGFTLVELLLGMAASLLVLAGLGSILLGSQLRMQRNSETVQTLKAHATRAASLISDEIGTAESLATSLSTAYPTTCSSTSSPSSLLVLRGPTPDSSTPLWTTIYGVRAASSLDPAQGSWRGPNVLVRCGLPFAASVSPTAKYGYLNSAGSVTEQVLLDGLPNAAAFSPTVATTTSSSLARNATIALTLQAATGGTTYTYTFGARAATNPVFAYLNNINLGTSTTCSTTGTTSTPCQSSTITNENVQEWRPTGVDLVTINGDTQRDDIIYFPKDRSAYTTFRRTASDSASCTRISCYISDGSLRVLIRNGNLLVFADQQVRL